MTTDRATRARLAALLLGSLFTVAALAGCLGSDDDAEPGTAAGADEAGSEGAEGTDGDPLPGEEDPNGEGDAPAEEEPAPCVPSTTRLHEWGFDGPAVPDPSSADPEGDPMQLLAATGAESFQVAEGTGALEILASAGDFVTLGFTVNLVDPSGSIAFSFDGAPGPSLEGVTGEPPAASMVLLSPTIGTWTLAWSITGYVEMLQVQVDAETCA